MEPWQKERDTRRSSRRRPSGCWPSRAARIRRRPRRSNRSPRIWGRAGDAAPLAQQDGRHGRGGDQAVGRRRDGGVEEFAGRGRAIEAGERDIDDGVGFFRGTARPDTALMVAYIDEFKDRFRVGPVRGVLAASPDCGFITPRGYRMFRSRPVSRMAARHEAPARDILEIHADSFMAVYGYRKTHARSLARGRDPAG